MGSILYLTIEQKNSSPSFPNYGPQNSTTHFLQRHCPPPTLATCWEVLFAAWASLITTAYTIRHEQRVVSHSDSLFQPKISLSSESHFAFILDPPPALMLGSCLLLGCSISSFAYRRQEEDRFQTPIFMLAITVAAMVGFGWGVNPNLIMLGLIPWALCCSMVVSTMVHWLVRRCSRPMRFVVREIGEKEVLIQRCV